MKKLETFLNENEIEKSKCVMEEYFDILSNQHNPTPINEANLNKILTTHHKNGFVIISANRSDDSHKDNVKHTRELIADIKEFGNSYFPVYGGYKGTDGVKDEYEPSFFITCFKKKNQGAAEFEDLKKFAIEMCKKYNQDSVLVVEPEGKPQYIDKEGKVIGKQGEGATKISDLSQEFFTALKKSKDSKLFKGKKDGTDRFTYDMEFECYSNPSPCTLNERIRRSYYGEIFL